MNPTKVYFWTIFSLIVMAAPHAHADVVNYALDNVTLADSTQITGTFSWTFDVGDFEGGVGKFTALEIPWRPGGTLPPLEEPGMVLTIENNQIEISLDGNFHDWGLDVSLKFLQPLSPTQPSVIDVTTSSFECCGNGFKDQLFISGSISPVPLVGDANDDGVLDNFDIAPFVQALTMPAAYAAAYPGVDPNVVLDMNNDGVFDNFDISGFVAALTGP